MRRHLDSVTPDTPIWDIADRCRVWESHSDAHCGYRSSPTSTKTRRGPPGIARDLWEVGDTTPNRLTAPVTMVGAVPPVDPTAADVLQQQILNQTGNCGDGSPSRAGFLLANYKTRGVVIQMATPAEPTILNVVAQQIWDQTLNCGGRSSTTTGSMSTNFVHTLTVTGNRPVRRESPPTRSLSPEAEKW